MNYVLAANMPGILERLI